MTMNIVIFHQMLLGYMKPTKTDGATGFNANDLSNGTHRLYTILCLLFNSMLSHSWLLSEVIGKISDYINP